MSVRLHMLIQCDACGADLDEKYPPEVWRPDTAFSDDDIESLRDQATHTLKHRNWEAGTTIVCSLCLMERDA